MDKREFIKKISLLGAASILPLSKGIAKAIEKSNSCTIIPTETAGPFPLDLTENTAFLRQNIKENKTGVPLNVKLKIIGNANCLPMQNLRVNIWHCDKDGLYSGYSTTNNQGQAGLTYLRGYQFTDSNGEVEFQTIFPGWYTGRICHIHFQVYVSSNYAAVSQLTFDVNAKNAIYSANSSLYTKGIDPMSLSSDNIFSDGYQYQIASLTANSVTGGYDTSLEVTIQGTGSILQGNIEKENAKNFKLEQNFPNPFTNKTTIPYYLNHNSDVKIDLFNLEGQKIHEAVFTQQTQGNHQYLVDFDSIGIPAANYIYQLEIKNENGLYRDCKMMTKGN